MIKTYSLDLFIIREQILIGYTEYNEKQVKKILEKLGQEFKGNKYHLLYKNCNHFTNAFIQVIC